MAAREVTFRLSSHFRGCMVGALLGDCLGSPFEGEINIPLDELKIYLQSKLKAKLLSDQVLQYSDDTAMTRSIVRSLLDHKGFNAVDMAKRFAEEYFKEPDRNYGGNVVQIFRDLLKCRTSEDAFAPAREQFNGLGSYGNGGAMRVAPVALFTFNDDMYTTANLAKQTALLTHYSALGYNGAILLALAVKEVLRIKKLNLALIPNEYVDVLINQMNDIETEPKFYTERLEIVKVVLKDNHWTPKTVADELGNYVTAPKSVPTSIYVFLKGLELITFFETNNAFVRTLFLAFSIGGDTDTIGSMAGAIAGAYHGVEMIPEALQEWCEGRDTAIHQADDLVDFVKDTIC